MKFESLLLVPDKARDQEKIRELEQENARMRKFESKNKDLKRENKDFKREIKDLKRENKDFKREIKDLKRENKDFKREIKDLKSENKDLKRGNKGLAKKVRELEGTTHVAAMGQRPDPQSKTEPFSFDPYKDVF